MQNSPEESEFHELESRMRNYSEKPDDAVWNTVFSKLHPGEVARGAYWRDLVAAVALLVFFSWTSYDIITENKGIVAHTPISVTPGNDSPDGLEKEIHSPNKKISDASNQSLHSKPHSINSTTSPDIRKVVGNKLPVASQINNSSQKNTGEVINDISAESSATTSPSFAQSNQVQKDEKTDSVIISAEKLKPDSAIASDPAKVINKKSTKKGFTIYALLTPSLSFYSVTPSANDRVIVRDFQNPSITSVNRVGIALDAGVQGQITGRLGFLAGISLYRQTQTLHYTAQYTDGNIIQVSGNDYYVKPEQFDQSVNYTMLNAGIQAGLLYTVKDHLLTHRIGIIGQYQKGFYKSSDSRMYNNSESQYVSYQVVYRLEFAATTKMKFLIQPSVTSNLWSDESLHAPFSLKQYRGGIGLGVTYQIH